MNFIKKLFSSQKPAEPKVSNIEIENLPIDQIFAKKFIKNQGKFLYCASLSEVTENISNIIEENSWDEINCNDYNLQKLIKTIKVKTCDKLNNKNPLFISCEHLIAENGSVLFSSNQIKEFKLSELSENFIVFATTSQLVKDKGESLTGINTRYKGNKPSNISAIKSFNPNSNDDDFMNYGNTNSKNLYLLLFEDL